jgi:hypothetical protein
MIFMKRIARRGSLAVLISSSVDSGRANAYASMASSRPPERKRLKAGHGEPTEPGQRVKAVALVDVHHLVDLADNEDVGS